MPQGATCWGRMAGVRVPGASSKRLRQLSPPAFSCPRNDRGRPPHQAELAAVAPSISEAGVREIAEEWRTEKWLLSTTRS